MKLFDRITARTKPSQDRLQRTPPAVGIRIKNIFGIQRLETMPLQAARAFQLASDPKAGMADFIDVIESDEALSARVIRIANSVYFFRGSQATDIEKAVTNIGIEELRCLLSATMLRSLLSGRQPAREQVWANAVATAFAARSLASRTNIGQGEAFLCGLLHDVGKLIMIRRANDGYEKAVNLAASGPMSFVEAEETIFTTNHVEVGKWVSENWGFPETVIRAVARHHEPWPEGGRKGAKNLSSPVLIKVADTMAHASGIGHPPHLRSVREAANQELDRAFSTVGLRPEDGQSFLAALKKQFEDEYALYQLERK